jgi:hypothetical protein
MSKKQLVKTLKSTTESIKSIKPIESLSISSDSPTKIINRGTGAGGANTNKTGLKFEEKTCIENYLANKKYNKICMKETNKNCYYYKYEDIEKKQQIIYFTKSGFKMYFREHFDISTYKEPDEAFLIIKDGKYHLKILEKKNQNVSGSVEEKLKTGDFIRQEYELMLNDSNKKNKFQVSFAFCVSKYLQDKLTSNTPKYINMNKIMKKQNIEIFFGDNSDYHDKLYNWIIL